MSDTLETNLIQKKSTGKNGQIATIATIFRCAIGLGIMNNPIFFAQSGWVLGSVLTIVTSYLVSYNMVLYADVIQELEEKHPDSSIDQMEDCIEYLIKSKRWQRVFYISKDKKFARFRFF